MYQKFLNGEKPPIVAMVLEKTPELAKEKIRAAINDGADAIGVQLECFERRYRTRENLKAVFAECKGLPIYITSYRNSESTGLSDDECAELLLTGLECGADLCDVMGDLYHPEPIEITFNEAAIRKQRQLVDKIHSAGAQVLISSHLHKFVEEDDIIKFALSQQSRGTDIVKIVSFATDEEQLVSDLKIVKRLKKELDKPFLFLANGEKCHLLRQMGVTLGVSMYLCKTNTENTEQPSVRTVKFLRDEL